MTTETDTAMAGTDQAIDRLSGLRWWITPTAIKSMVTRCPDWLSLRARQGFADNLPGAAAEEIKAMVNRATVVDTITNDTAFMSTVVARYGRTAKHGYRIMNGRQGDRCVFVCCENTISQQQVMITVLHYSADSVRSGLLPSRHLMAARPVARRDRAT